MSTQMESTVQKTGKPVAAGIIDIIVGSLCLLAVLGFGIGMAVCSSFVDVFPFNFPWLFGILAIIPAAMGIVSITGGVFAVQRKIWGWALAGSITTVCLSHILGIISIVLTVLSKNEFSGSRSSQ
jgi:hypothetical protein